MPSPGLRKRVSSIPGDPSPHGLLGGCTSVIYVTDSHELNGTELAPITGADVGTWIDCPVPPQTNPAAKTYSRVGSCAFNGITLYAGVECSTFGVTQAELEQLALDQLAMGSQAALEEWFQAEWLCPNSDDVTPGGGAVNIAVGVGLLEQWLAQNYGGKGVLHIPAGAAALASRSHVVDFPQSDGESPETLMGNCVVLGAGYAANIGGATCTVAPAGQAWLYITPPVRVRRDRPFIVPGSERASVNKSNNDRRTQAESSFVVEVANCRGAMVLVDLTVCC